jgi:Putative addiction module component
MSLKEILEGLPDLTDEERARLHEELAAFGPDHERAWAQTAEERLASIRSGEKQAISVKEVFAKARHSIGE